MTNQDRVRASIEELRSLRSTDPCAAILMTTIKATVHTLNRYWTGEDPPTPRSGTPV